MPSTQSSDMRQSGTQPTIEYDHRGALVGPITQALLESQWPRVDEARERMLADTVLYESNGEVPIEKQPLDAGFVHLPQRLLAEYRADRLGSELGQILATAARLRGENDRIVVLGIGGSYMGARALKEACCHPYHDQLSPADRGGRPRMYFAGNNLDNDAAQGVLDLLRAETEPSSAWSIVVISKSGGTLETAAAFRTFLDALRQQCGDRQELASRVVPVTGRTGKLYELAVALGCPEMFRVPDGVGGRFSVFSPVGLLPAAILGLDIIALLQGAADMTEHFYAAPAAENLVLRYTNVCHTAEQQAGMDVRVMSVWSDSLESVGFWHDQLLAESLGKEERGSTPLTVVNTRDLHSRAQQHQEGKRDKLINNVIVRAWRRDSLSVPRSDLDQDELNRIAGRTYPRLMDAAIAGTNQAYREAGRPTTDIVLPQVNERSLGELMQMLMLATVVEGHLLGVNPYGQPGVEAYKKHMKRFLEQNS